MSIAALTAKLTASESAALFFHPLVKPSHSSVPPTSSSWTDERNKQLALAVRRHLFDFAAAADELGGGVDAEECRRHWAELDLAACVGYAEAAPVVDEGGEATPSDFNIFRNSLSMQMDTIFSGPAAPARPPPEAETDEPPPLEDDDEEDEDAEEDDDEREEESVGPPAGAAPQPTAAASARFVASFAPTADASRGGGRGCRVVLHSSLPPPKSEDERRERAARAAALAASRAPEALGSGVDGSSGGAVVATTAAAAAGATAATSSSAGSTGDFVDASVWREAALQTLPAEAVPATGLWLLRVACAGEPAADLAQLPGLLGEVLRCFPLARAATAPGLVALQLAVHGTPSAPLLFAAVRGPPKAIVQSAPTSAALREALEAAQPADDVAEGWQALMAAPAADAARVGSVEADAPLAHDLDAAPPLPRTVVALKEHMLGERAAVVLDELPAADFALVGARLVYLQAQSSALLGLDSPLAPGPVVALLVEGFDAAERIQALAGAADPKIARTTDVGSWRARLGVDRALNVLSTPRHAKGAQRAAAFFFGPRETTGIDVALAAPPLPLVMRRPRSLVLLLTRLASSPAASTCALLSCVQRAGLALHRAMRVDGQQRQALGVHLESDDGAPRLAFLLSRAGPAFAVASRAVAPSAAAAGDSAALAAVIAPCAPEVASALLATAGAAPCPLSDMYKFTIFQVKNELL